MRRRCRGRSGAPRELQRRLFAHHVAALGGEAARGSDDGPPAGSERHRLQPRRPLCRERVLDKKVKLWDGRTGAFLATLTGHVGAVYKVAWSMDSRLLVSASKDSTIKLWDANAPKTAMHTLPCHADEVYALDWSPNGAQVASGSKDRTIKIWRN